MTICRINRSGKDLAELGISVVCSENRQAMRPICPQQSGEEKSGQRCVGGGGGRGVMPLENREPHRMRGVEGKQPEARLHTPGRNPGCSSFQRGQRPPSTPPLLSQNKGTFPFQGFLTLTTVISTGEATRASLLSCYIIENVRTL